MGISDIIDRKDFLDFIQYNFGMYTDGNIDEDDFLQAIEEYLYGISTPRGYNLNGEFIEREPSTDASIVLDTMGTEKGN